jgi:tetratricopeptide (TPR) repeat protein
MLLNVEQSLSSMDASKIWQSFCNNTKLIIRLNMKIWCLCLTFLCVQVLVAQKTNAHEWLEEGRKAYARGEWDTAVRCFGTAYLSDNELDTALVNRAVVYLAQEKYDKAVDDLTAYLATHTSEAEVYMLRAQAYFGTEKPQDAIADLNSAVMLMPSIEYFSARAQAHLATGNDLLAESDFRTILKREPNNETAFRGLGDVFTERSDYLAAKNFYRNALEQDSTDLLARLQLGITMARLTDYLGAVRLIDAVVTDTFGVEALTTLAFCHLRLGDVTAASKYAEQAKSIQISSPDTWHILGMIAAYEGKNAEAILCFDEVLAIDAQYAQAWYNAGKVHYESSTFDLAFQYLSTALEFQEVRGAAAMALANLKLTLQDDAEACRYFKMASNIGYEAHAEEEVERFCKE